MSYGSSKPADYTSLVNACVQHLSANSAHYFSIIQNKGQDGVLWAVFVAPSSKAEGSGSVDTKSGASPSVKRASFLPLETVMTTKAQSLVQMYNSCNHSSQFVTWFTLESSNGEALVSKVMIVDVRGGGGHTSSMAGGSSSANNRVKPLGASANSLGNTFSSFYVDPTKDDSVALQELKDDMMTFQKQREMQKKHAGAQGSSPAALADERHRYMHEIEGKSTAAASAQKEATQSQYQQILRVSLQVADSVAKMGAAIDELTSRVDRIQVDLDTRNKGPSQDDIVQAIAKQDALEARLDQIEARIQSFDDIQQNFFDQMQAIKQHYPVSMGAASIGSMQPQRLPAPTATTTTAPSSSSLTSATPRGQRMEDNSPKQQPEQQGPQSSIVSDGSAPTATNAAPTTPSQSSLYTARERRHNGGDAENNVGGGGGGSLGDMIKAMETKLSRIRTPGRTGNTMTV